MPERFSEAGLRLLSDRLVAELGGYLRNAVRETGVTCVVCAGPIAPPYVECFRCRADRLRFGDELADVVVPISYGIKGGQSGQLMWMYKHPTNPVARYRTLLTVLLLVTVEKHGPCLTRAAGLPIDAWAVVPSTTGREGEHPLRVIARRVMRSDPEVVLRNNPQWTGDDRDTRP